MAIASRVCLSGGIFVYPTQHTKHSLDRKLQDSSPNCQQFAEPGAVGSTAGVLTVTLGGTLAWCFLCVVSIAEALRKLISASNAAGIYIATQYPVPHPKCAHPTRLASRVQRNLAFVGRKNSLHIERALSIPAVHLLARNRCLRVTSRCGRTEIQSPAAPAEE